MSNYLPVVVERAHKEVFALVEAELVEAEKHYPRMRSPEEGFTIIMEEYLELRAEICSSHDLKYSTAGYARMRKEAIQLAAMVIRMVNDTLY